MSSYFRHLFPVFSSFFIGLCWSVLCCVLTGDISQVSGILSVFISLHFSGLSCELYLLWWSPWTFSSTSSTQGISLSLPRFPLFVLYSENSLTTVNWAMVVFMPGRVPSLRHYAPLIPNVKGLANHCVIYFVWLFVIVGSCEMTNLVFCSILNRRLSDFYDLLKLISLFSLCKNFQFDDVCFWENVCAWF